MMLSVVKSTKSPVKFWFVKNFLSPKFKVPTPISMRRSRCFPPTNEPQEFLPALSKELNCSVELVTYKWPSWLHQETEKQRVIWGLDFPCVNAVFDQPSRYKILFLDVLFPLNVKKIIYVDADQVRYLCRHAHAINPDTLQVARADLKELADLDLHGAPYGYTPFCSSRKEMDGYR